MIPKLALERGGKPLLIGVVHLPATPGSPGFAGDHEALILSARADAEALAAGGCDALIVENFGDSPFFAGSVPSETVAAMALAVAEVERVTSLPVGVNVLRNDARSALGLCATTDASFLRINVHCGAYVTDQGLVQGQAAETLRERNRLAPDAAILADVHVKHAVPLGGQSLNQAARDTFLRGRADALVLSGNETGAACDPVDVLRVREALPDAPLLIGSGLTTLNATEYLPAVDGAIVGTSLKLAGDVARPVERERVVALRRALDAARS